MLSCVPTDAKNESVQVGTGESEKKQQLQIIARVHFLTLTLFHFLLIPISPETAAFASP